MNLPGIMSRLQNYLHWLAKVHSLIEDWWWELFILAIIKTHSCIWKNNVYSRFLKCKMKIVAQLIWKSETKTQKERQCIIVSSSSCLWEYREMKWKRSFLVTNSLIPSQLTLIHHKETLLTWQSSQHTDSTAD